VPVRLAVAALALTCALAAPFALSDDVWAYAAYGALLLDGRDPWSAAWHAAAAAPHGGGWSAAAPPHDPVLSSALARWGGSLPRDVYGPVFTGLCALVVAATRSLGPDAAVAGLRALAAAALLACVALASRRRRALSALLAYHPVILWSAAEGHNDALCLALVLAADRLRPSAGPVPASAGRVAAKNGLLIAATAVKAVAALPLAWSLAALPRRRRLGPAVAAAALLLVAYAPLLRDLLAHGPDAGPGAPRLSLVHGAALAAWAGSPLPAIAAAVLGAAWLAGCARLAGRGERVAAAALLGWSALPGPEPWYALWLAGAAAVTGTARPGGRALLAASFTGAFAYLQDALPGTAWHDGALVSGTMFLVYAVPLAVALLLQPASPAPTPNPVPPTPPALVTPAPPPTPAPAPSGAPQPAPSGAPQPSPAGSPQPIPSGAPSPGAVASPAANPFRYVVAPPDPPAASPRIVEIALNDKTLHQGGSLLVRITTSPDVTAVVARTLGREIGIPQSSPGVFAGMQQLPTGIPFFLLNRTYQVDFVASTADGRSASYTLPIRLER